MDTLSAFFQTRLTKLLKNFFQSSMLEGQRDRFGVANRLPVLAEIMCF